MKKRSFLKGLALAGISAPFSAGAMDSWIQMAAKKTAAELAADDDFWTVNSADG